MNPPPPLAPLDVLAAALMEDAVGAIVISVAIVALFGGAEVGRRLLGLRTELTRKFTHVGAGAVVLSFPWLIGNTWTVAVLAVAFAGILIGGKITGLLGSIHDVERRTGGAYYYPFAVLGTWILSGGDPLHYCVPLAVMAVADTGAALVGQRAGETTFQVMDGERSLEGSLAFFALAFGVTLIGCALAGRPGWPSMLLVTLVVAGLATAAEAVSVRGSDNLAIPYAAWLALDRTDRLGLESLGDWVLGMAIGVTVLLISAERARLKAAGAVVVFMVCTLGWALGGLAWILPLAVLWGLYLLVRDADHTTELDMVFPTTAGSMIVLLLYAHTADPRLFVSYLATVAANGAMAGALIGGQWGRWAIALGALIGAAIPIAAVRLLDPTAPLWLPLVAGLIAPLLFVALDWMALIGRRPVASLVCGLAVWWMVTG